MPYLKYSPTAAIIHSICFVQVLTQEIAAGATLCTLQVQPLLLVMVAMTMMFVWWEGMIATLG